VKEEKEIILEKATNLENITKDLELLNEAMKVKLLEVETNATKDEVGHRFEVSKLQLDVSKVQSLVFFWEGKYIA